MNQPVTAKYQATALGEFSQALLAASGLTGDPARDVAEVLLEGDLLGHTTHGFALLPNYLQALKEHTMTKTGDPQVIADQDAALTWDGRYLPGPWLVRRAIAAVRERLVRHPVVTVVIRRSHHIGCLQAYLKPVTDAGLFMLLSCTDPACRVVAPPGGTAPRFSPNPVAAGIPTNGDPILIDISTSTTALAPCKRLAADSGRLPGPWLMNHEGNSSNDPRILFNGKGGSLLPLGGVDLGYEGFALALLMEALTSALGGHGRADGETRWGASVFLQIINPDNFGGRQAFQREMDFLAQSCWNTPVPAGKPPVRLPGQAALARRTAQLANGVELHPSILPALIPWAESLNVTLPRSL